MDVRLPSGQIIRGVPDGTSRSELRMRLLKNGINPDAPAPAVDPTEGMIGLEKFSAGVGKAIVDTGRGLQQLTGLGDQEALSQKIAEERELTAPLMDTGAGMAGNIGGNVAMALAPGGALVRAGKAMNSARVAAAGRQILNPTTLRGAAVQGAAISGAQPVVEGESRGMNAALGAGLSAGGLGLVRGAGALVSGVGTKLNPQQAEVARRASEVGLELSPGEATGSRALRIAEAGLGSTPGGAAVFQRGAISRQQRINEIAGEAIGRPGQPAITREVLDDVADELGQKYDALRGVKRIELDKRFAVDMRRLKNEQTSRSAQLQDAATNKLIDDYRESATGAAVIDGRRLVSDIKALRKQARDAFRSGNSDLGQAKRQIAEALENNAERSLRKQGASDVLDNFRQARERFSKLFAVEAAHDEATGNVSAAKLGTALRRQSPKKFGTRGDDLETVGLYGQAFKPFQSSGTAERLSTPLLLGGGYLGGMAFGDDPTDPAKAAAAAYLLPGGAALALNNPVARNYLLRGIPGLREIPRNALSRAARPAAIAAPNALLMTRD